MATPEARTPRFFKEFPQGFLKKHGGSLPKYACLEVPTGAMWKVKLKRRQGRVWLHHGWREFLQHCSIKAGYFIVFRFDGGSFFHVLVFDPSTMEIDYPVSPARTHHQVNSDQSEDQEQHTRIKVEDSEVYEDEEDDNRTSDDDDDDDGQVKEDGNMLLQRAREFQTTNPHFFVTIKPSYICSGCYLHVPTGHANTYFHEKEDNGTLRLIGEGGKAWSVKYSVQFRRTSGVKLVGGWSRFARENHLQGGDVCVFELVKDTPMAYKVTIFKAPEKASPKEDDDARRRVLRRGKGLKSNRPHFTIQICRTHVTRGDASIPMNHARRYLKDARRDQNVIVLHGSKGRTWPVPYNFPASDQDKSKLRFKWMSFMSDNQLEVGDVCVFEMIGGKAKDYRVTILRVADYA